MRDCYESQWIEFYPEGVPEAGMLWTAQIVTAYKSGSVECAFIACSFDWSELEESIRAVIPTWITGDLPRHIVSFPTESYLAQPVGERFKHGHTN